jgi:hypothetical protein
MRLSTTGFGIGTSAVSAQLHVHSGDGVMNAMFGNVANNANVYIYSGTLNRGYGVNGNSDLALCYNGYLNGQSQFRDVTIWDGKHGGYAIFDGSRSRLGIG